MVITEIFKSIQGEGTRAGLPCIFVRLTGCNLRCTWCDTAYAFHGGTKYTLDEVLEKVQRSLSARSRAQHSLVEITGGEPLLQPETPALARKLLAAGYTVMIETSGERFVGALPARSNQDRGREMPRLRRSRTRSNMANLDAVDRKDEIKFVIASRRDYDFARDFTERHELAKRVHQVLVFSGVSGSGRAMAGIERAGTDEWILADGLPVRLGLQLHKFIWDPAMKGV